MLKYTDSQVVFREVPDQITLAINISGCPCACIGCHSSYLAEDIGDELNELSLDKLLKENDMVSCMAFMGGDGDPSEISRLAGYLRLEHPELKVAWYSGRDELSHDVELENFDYIKIGSYQQAYGPLDSPTTNQRLYRVQACELIDITQSMRSRFNN